MIEPHSDFVDTDTLRLHYLAWDSEHINSTNPPLTGEQTAVQNNDEIPLVLLHGLGATADTWRLVAHYLWRHHPIIAFDQRGHGQSEQPEEGYDLTTMAEDAIHGMAALGLGKVALVAHGWGARVALVLAARHPALVSHLILVDCPHVEPRHWPDMTRERFITDHAPQKLYTSRQTFIDAMRDDMRSFWSPEIEAIVQTYIRDLPDGRVEECLGAEQQRRIRESLWEDRALSYYGKLTCPVLLVPAAAQPRPGEEPPERLEHSDEFAAAKGYMAEQVARMIPRCSVLWMPDTSHEIQLQRPQVLSEAISTFMH